jgi:superfamily II DNA or RNA helicase
MKPYRWQESAVARFVRSIYFCLAVDCGCGKTFAAIWIALLKKLPVIVIAPGHRLCEQWKNDIEDMAGKEADVWLYDKPTETKQGAYYQERFEQWLQA